MKWKTKARIQNTIAALPSSISYSTYYWAQKHFGRLKKYIPTSRISAAVRMWKLSYSLGIDPTSKIFFEIGTGRVPIIPITNWLMGAGTTITVDLNPFLKRDIIRESIDYICENTDEIKKLLDPFLIQKRFNELIKLGDKGKIRSQSVLELCQIKYIAPADAAKTNLKNESIDFYTSFVTLEHIPFVKLKDIIREGNRIIKKNGLFIHRIDYSDHFAYTDNSIPAINFLQYSDSEWDSFAGNRYMYMNRLRHDDFINLFESSGHRILIDKPDVDTQSLNLLKSSVFPLNEKFKDKSNETLATVSTWIVTQKVLNSE